MAFTEHHMNWYKRKEYNFSAAKAEKVYYKSSDLIAVFQQKCRHQDADTSGRNNAEPRVSDR